MIFRRHPRHEGMTVDDFGFLSDRSTRPARWIKPNDRPWQIVIDHAGSVLKVLTFREDIGRDKDARLRLGG